MNKMMLRVVMGAAVLAGLSLAGTVSADVFNMGGTRDPITGVWTGLASLETVPVGNANNIPDPATGNLGGQKGQINYNYNIGKYDVTAAQYTAFLNAVAQTDTYGLYNTSMATDTSYGCGITRTGNSGSYSYWTTKNGNFPVNYVSFGDTMRFANWLQNGQPTGVQDNSTTEDGAYFVNGATSDVDLNAVSRKSNWQWAVTSEDEWYKAAYYDPNKTGFGNAGYWLYPTRNDTAPSNVLSATGTNNANYYDIYGTGTGGWTDPVSYLTAVGAFASSPSSYGTFDQGGDVFGWNEAIIEGSYRGLRGGSFGDEDRIVRAVYSNYFNPSHEFLDIGFRVVQVPFPSAVWAGVVGLALVAARRLRR